MRIALGQIDSRSDDFTGTLDKHIRFIDQAVRERADLIVFPELSLSGDQTGAESLAITSGALVRIAELSCQIDVVVGLQEVGGSETVGRYNSAFYYSQGRLVHRHRKLFLLDYAVWKEGRHLTPGDELRAFDTRLGRQCMLICNDVWHAPAPYLAALDGASLLIVPANSAQGTLAKSLDIAQTWQHMNRAYAAMMGFYIIFVNRVGVLRADAGSFGYWGGSEIIGPDGREVLKAPYDDEALVIGEIDLAAVEAHRRKAPLIRDARLSLLQQEIRRLAAQPEGQPIQEGNNPSD